MEKYIHEIQLQVDGDFAKRFNEVSALFAKWTDAVDEDKEAAWDEFKAARFRLEMGM